MPVIGSKAKRGGAKDERAVLVDRLFKEWSGKSTKDGPVIFEVPKGRAGKMDVMVIWNEWSSVPFQQRWDIIDEAFQLLQEQNRGRSKTQPKTIMMAFGATVSEAVRNGLLPYSVQETYSGNHPFDKEMLKKIREAMIKCGAISLSNGDVALAFPTREMAENAIKALRNEVPRVEWMINQAAD